MVVSELRGEKIDIIPWNNEPARFVAKALSPARVREVYIDDETKDATVVVPDDQLALAIGKEGLNARLAARLTGWKVDIQSDSEFAQAEAEAAFAGADGDQFTGRCVAILSTGKRCPNSALPGTRFCGVPAHQELAQRDAAGEDLGDQIVQMGGADDDAGGEVEPGAELVRFVAKNGALMPGRTEPGRGVYTCRRLACFERAAARRAFSRVLRKPVQVEPSLMSLYTDPDG